MNCCGRNVYCRCVNKVTDKLEYSVLPKEKKILTRKSYACSKQLQNSHSSVQTVLIYGVFPFTDLNLPSVSKMSKLEVTKRYVGELEPFCNCTGTTDYETVMPRLEEVKICTHTGFFRVDRISTDRDLEWEADWPPEGDN